VAVTGLGSISAAGKDVPELLASLAARRVRSGPVPPWLFTTALKYPVFAGPREVVTSTARFLLDQAAPHFLPETVSRTVLLALSATAEGLAQAGVDLALLRSCRVGIAFGTTVGCTFHNEEYYNAWRHGLQPDLQPVRYFLGANLAAALHAILGTRGPAAVVTNACASGTDAIGLARDWLNSGQCDIAIAGGADELSRVAYNGFVSLMLADTAPCRPFSDDRQGLNLGEGSGVIILESAALLSRRKHHCLGWVRGYGAASDAWHPTAPHPEGRGLKDALAIALADADIEASAISFVNAHGTGTKANDLAETTALKDFLPEHLCPPVVSTKGITGHTLGAAGGIEAVLTLMALRAGITSGTVGCHNPDPGFPIRPLPEPEQQSLNGRIGISQSLAFGGGNAVLVLEAAL